MPEHLCVAVNELEHVLLLSQYPYVHLWAAVTELERRFSPFSIPVYASVCGSDWLKSEQCCSPFSIPACASVCGSHWIRTMLFFLFHTRMCTCVRQSLNQNNAVLPFPYPNVYLCVAVTESEQCCSSFSIPECISVCGSHWIRTMLCSLFDTCMCICESEQCCFRFFRYPYLHLCAAITESEECCSPVCNHWNQNTVGPFGYPYVHLCVAVTESVLASQYLSEQHVATTWSVGFSDTPGSLTLQWREMADAEGLFLAPTTKWQTFVKVT